MRILLGTRQQRRFLALSFFGPLTQLSQGTEIKRGLEKREKGKDQLKLASLFKSSWREGEEVTWSQVEEGIKRGERTKEIKRETRPEFL